MKKAIVAMLENLFNPCIKLAEHEGLLFPTDDESKAILKIFSGSPWLPVSQYDELLKWLSTYGLSIEVTVL